MQDNSLVSIVEPEILLDGRHGIDRTLEVAQKVWSKVFFLAENNVLFEGILLKPSMVTPGAECPETCAPICPRHRGKSFTCFSKRKIGCSLVPSHLLV
jgi:fructose-bisphosphate aldolase class 1